MWGKARTSVPPEVGFGGKCGLWVFPDYQHTFSSLPWASLLHGHWESSEPSKFLHTWWSYWKKINFCIQGNASRIAASMGNKGRTPTQEDRAGSQNLGMTRVTVECPWWHIVYSMCLIPITRDWLGMLPLSNTSSFHQHCPPPLHTLPPRVSLTI